MQLRSTQSSALVAAAACMLVGCASAPPSGTERPAADVKVYGRETNPPAQYEIVRRLWVDSWRAAFWLPTYPSEGEAIAAMQVEAGRSGADGLINVYCLDQGRAKWWSSSSGPAILCYGNAIRLQKTG